MKRLNGWQRIGIVLSVLWSLGGGLWGNNIGIHEGDTASAIYSLCLENRPNDWQGCSTEFTKNWTDAVQYHWWYAAILGLVPIPIVWGMVYGILGIIRWIRRGFKKSENDVVLAHGKL